MLLFQKRFHAGLVSGDVKVTFRRWARPHVKPGGRYRCHPIGVLEVDRVDRIKVAQISDGDAVQSGFGSRDELLDYLGSGPAGELSADGEVWRIELHHGGDGDRVELALAAELSAQDVDAIERRLAKLDGKAPWTRKTLLLIRRHPRVAASRLAARLGRETLPFKEDVRKLKRLGLTQSFEVGYELSPRGERFLALAGRRRRKPRSRA